MRQNTRMVLCGVAAAVIGSSVLASAQIRRSPPVTDPRQAADAELRGVAMHVSLTAGGQRYESSVPGKCTHAPMASIYGVVSELWTAQQSDGDKSLNLTLWQPKDGSRSMLSLTVTTGKTTHRVSTIRGATIAGNAKTQFESSLKGGTFTIYAKSAEGADVMGTVKCEAFTPHIAEGGL